MNAVSGPEYAVSALIRSVTSARWLGQGFQFVDELLRCPDITALYWQMGCVAAADLGS